MWDQTVPIPDNGAKIWSRENRARKVYFFINELKLYALASSILPL